MFIVLHGNLSKVLRFRDHCVYCRFHVAPGLEFTDQFIQLSAYLSSRNIYGLGEHVTSLRLPMDNSVFTLFAADIFPNPDVNIDGLNLISTAGS